MPFILVNGYTPPFPLELSKKKSLSLVGYSQAVYSSECLKIWSNRLFFHLKAYPALLCTVRNVQHVTTGKSRWGGLERIQTQYLALTQVLAIHILTFICKMCVVHCE